MPKAVVPLLFARLNVACVLRRLLIVARFGFRVLMPNHNALSSHLSSYH